MVEICILSNFSYEYCSPKKGIGIPIRVEKRSTVYNSYLISLALVFYNIFEEKSRGKSKNSDVKHEINHSCVRIHSLFIKNAVFALAKWGAGAKPHWCELKHTICSLPPPQSSRGPPPSSEGGEISKCKHSFLDIETLKHQEMLIITIFYVSTHSLPPSEEGGGPRLDRGGGRDFDFLKFPPMGLCPCTRLASANKDIYLE